MFHKLITISNFENLAQKAAPISLAVAGIALLIGLPMALFSSPEDYQQGSTVRIMYVHVPAAFMSLSVYIFMAGLSISYLVWRNPLAYLLARNAAPIGAVFALICLVTGSIWGHPTWGTWWEWREPRLMSMLLLFFIYIGYIALGGAFNSDEKEAKSASILAIVGLINIPIIKYSVEWWNTLHQPASFFRLGQEDAVHGSMSTPLYIMLIAFLAIFIAIFLNKSRAAIINKKLNR